MTLEQWSLGTITDAQPPKNAANLSIKLNFDKDRAATHQQLGLTDFLWVRENGLEIFNHYNTPSRGVFRGMPLKYKITRAGIIEPIFDGYLDLSDAGTLFNCQDGVQAPAKELWGVDWLNDVADNVSFEALHKVFGEISANDFYWVPYVISKLPDYEQAFMLILQLISTVLELCNQFESFNEINQTFISFDWFEWAAILRVIFRILFIIFLIITLISITLHLINVIIQPIKYHACMKVIDLMRKGCEHFEYNLIAPDLVAAPFNNLMVMPQKYVMERHPENKVGLGALIPFTGLFDFAAETFGFIAPNIDQHGYLNQTFGNFMRDMKITFRSKIVINNTNTASGGKPDLYFIREDKFIGSPDYQLPDLYQPEFGTNASELKSNYLLSFLTDINDKNTIQQFIGTSFQVITDLPENLNDTAALQALEIALWHANNEIPLNQPKIDNLNAQISILVNSAKFTKELDMIKNLEDVTIPFARGIRKTELTLPEKIAEDLLGITGLLIAPIIIAYNGFASGINSFINAIQFLPNAINFFLPADKQIHLPIKNLPYIQPFGWFNNFLGDRIGMLLLENDFVNVQKMFLLEGPDGGDPQPGGRLPGSQEYVTTEIKGGLQGGQTVATVISPPGQMPGNFNRIPVDNNRQGGVVCARNFWGLWHGPAVSFLPSQLWLPGNAPRTGIPYATAERPNGNQFLIKQYDKVPFCFKQFLKLKVNNSMFSASGLIALLYAGEWFPYDEIAKMTIRISNLYASDLKEMYIEPDGK